MAEECTACEWRTMGPRIEQRIGDIEEGMKSLEDKIEKRVEKLQETIGKLVEEFQRCRETDRTRTEAEFQVVRNQVAKLQLNGCATREKLAVDTAVTKAKLASLYALVAFCGSVVGGVLVAVGTRLI